MRTEEGSGLTTDNTGTSTAAPELLMIQKSTHRSKGRSLTKVGDYSSLFFRKIYRNREEHRRSARCCRQQPVHDAHDPPYRPRCPRSAPPAPSQAPALVIFSRMEMRSKTLSHLYANDQWGPSFPIFLFSNWEIPKKPSRIRRFRER